MDRATILALNRINKDFYTQRAEEFVATRRGPWRGWLRLLEEVGEKQLSVLDVGCGNGRFALFLKEHLKRPFRYVGIEFSVIALQHARDNLSGMPSVTLREHDVAAGWPASPVPADVPSDFSLISYAVFFLKKNEYQ